MAEVWTHWVPTDSLHDQRRVGQADYGWSVPGWPGTLPETTVHVEVMRGPPLVILGSKVGR